MDHPNTAATQDPRGRTDALIDWFVSWAGRRLDIESFDRSDAFAPSEIIELAKAGMLGIGVPASLGGSELPVAEMLRVLRQMAAVDLTAAIFVLDSILGAHTARGYADHGRRDRVLAGIAAGRTITAVAITGPEAGSDPRAIEARARPDGEGGFRLDGEKWWVGNASWAEVIHVFVQLHDDAGKALGLTGFVVDAGSPGLRVGPAAPTLGLRGFPKNKVVLQGVRVGPQDLIGLPGQGFEAARSTFRLIRLLLGGMAVGTMKRCLQLMHRYAERRTISTGRLIDNPVTRLHLSESAAKTAALESLSDVTAQLLDRGAEVPDEVLMVVKNAGAELMGEVVDRAIQVLGARGYEESYGVARFYRDARPFRIFEGPTEALTAFVGASAAQPDSPLRAFLGGPLHAGDRVERLGRATAEIRDACQARGGALQGPQALYQTYSYVGELAMYLLLEAAARRSDEPASQAAAAWANGRGEEVVARAQASALMSPEALAQTVRAWGRDIKEVVRPASRVALDPLLTPPVERAPDPAWNDTAADFGPFRSVIQRIAERAAEDGDAAAVEQAGARLTRSELERRSNRLARWLLDHGVRRGELVAFSLPRSLEAIVTLHGIHKAGAAWLPLDPAYPRDRKALILEDAGVRIVITQRALIAELPTYLIHLCLDERGASEAFTASETPPEIVAGAGDLAYVIYTSGSTGKPKGVMIEHGALSHFVDAATRAYGITGADRVLQFASPSFDTAIEEIYPCLCAGGTVVLRTDDMLGSASLFFAAVSELRLTVLDLPTAFWHPLVDDMVGARLGVPACLRLVIIGGERCRAATLRKWIQHTGARPTLMNTYGPTESSVVATVCDLSRLAEGEAGRGEAPIGAPLPNVRCHVLDDALCPVLVNEPGELCLAGHGLARGYLGLPERTAESFVETMIAGHGMERIYRTGDIVRWGEDGRLYFVGRRDQQVKIRGYRVELGEVEAAVAALEGVRGAAVIARDDERGGARLLAYVEGPELGAGDALRRSLRERLPEHMVPATVVVMSALPMTVSGKVDRRSLPEPALEAPCADDSASPTEARLATLFEEVLGHAVARDMDFLAAGGNSLLAIQLVARVRDAFGVDLAVSDVFRAGTRAALSALIDAGARPTRAVALQRVSRADEHPLSHGQGQIWFLHSLSPAQPVYNEPIVLYVPEPVNAVALQQAFSALIERHESLRTAFPARGGHPVQKVLEPLAFQLEVQQQGAWDDAVRADALSFVQEPFVLSAPPLLRARLVHTGEAVARLVLVIHHLIVDGVSFYGVLLPELQALYEATASDREARLRGLDWHYVDYAAWQAREPLEESECAFWKACLANPPDLEMPTDRARPATASNRGDHVAMSFGKEATDRLRAFALRSGVTLFMLLVAGLDAVLHLYTGQEDLVIGTVVTQRRHAELEGVIGYFDNTLALRTDLGGQPSFQTLLERVRETVLQALAHQDLPFAKIVELMGAEGRRRGPLFRVALILEPPPEVSETSWRFTRQDLHAGAAKFDLMFELEDRPDGLRGRLEFSTDLYDRGTAARLARHLERGLRAAVSAPQTPIGALAILDGEERAQVVEGWNATAVTFPPVATVHALVEAAATRCPDAVAVRFEGAEMTYQELWERGLRLARLLHGSGVRRGSRVGLFVECGFDLVTCVLGILQAGAAYVPLDVAYPPERRTLMLEDAAVAAVVTQRGLLGDLAIEGVPIIHVDEIDLAGYPPSPVATDVGPDDLAYVIYTSGSTGRPKGVAMGHGALVNLVQWQRGASFARETTRTLQYSPISFDVSFQEMFSTWDTGGTLVLVSERMRREPMELLEHLDRERIERIFVPVAALGQLADATAHRASVPASLREVIVAGEQLLITSKVRSLFARLGGAELHNHYGPSETHVVTALFLRGDPDGWATRPTIGRPIANTAIYVLDALLSPTPVGVPGELYIGGAALARGYLGRADLSLERFVPDPFRPGGRMYRTGDRGRWLAGGEIEFLGRRDHQVKLRGYRIELGEIEAVLHAHPAVKEAVAGIVTSGPGREDLVAWVVAPTLELAARLTAHLAARLPDYMVPRTIMMLPALPLTPSGKVARDALPTPEGSTESSAGRMPRDPVELQLAQLWADVLGVDRVTLDDGFFSLGGHSLLAVSAMARVEQAFGVKLSLASLLGATVETMAGVIREAQQGNPRWSPLVSIQPRGLRAPVFCIAGSGGNVLCFQALAEALGPSQPLYGLQPRGLDGVEAPCSDFVALAAEYVEAIRGVQPTGPYRVFGHSIGAVVAFEVARQLEAAGERMDLLAVGDLPAPRAGASWPFVEWDDARWVYGVGSVLEHAGRALQLDLGLDVAALRATDDAGRRAALREAMEAAGILPRGASQSYVDGIVQTMKWAELQFAAYRPGSIEGPILVMRATEVLSLDGGYDIEPTAPEAETWGWEALGGEVTAQRVPGDHLSMLEPPNVERVARGLAEALEAGRDRHADGANVEGAWKGLDPERRGQISEAHRGRRPAELVP